MKVYTLTDRRAIIQIQDSRTQAVTVHSYHRGTIKSHPSDSNTPTVRATSTSSWKPTSSPAGFKDVADVRRVEELIRRFLIVPGTTSAA